MRTTLHAVVVSYRQAGLIVTSKTACAGRNVTVTIRPLRKHPDPESNRIAEVGSQGRSMTWGESLQCRMVRVGVSQAPWYFFRSVTVSNWGVAQTSRHRQNSHVRQPGQGSLNMGFGTGKSSQYSRDRTVVTGKPGQYTDAVV
jgi:hypothetical protein